MSTINLIIIVVAVTSVVVILGVRAGRERVAPADDRARALTIAARRG